MKQNSADARSAGRISAQAMDLPGLAAIAAAPREGGRFRECAGA
ncbi:hypothetical protein [Bosea sp. BIWAKO-01]|nr:hypothetical protein [Bosea sp. BIWAKO-01]GAU86370.1 hypothetical protein BIWAKO_06318 [Bosea sp. BIWAKO-01]